jgi:hypothetical protein
MTDIIEDLVTKYTLANDDTLTELFKDHDGQKLAQLKMQTAFACAMYQITQSIESQAVSKHYANTFMSHLSSVVKGM